MKQVAVIVLCAGLGTAVMAGEPVVSARAVSVAPATPAATSPRRHVPPECAGALASLDVPEADREAEWNLRYSETYRSAAGEGPIDDGVARACAALALSAGFDARDWRFAETLDELGLIQYERGSYEESARAQGMAAAEILHAKGPAAPEVGTYVGRLGMPMGRLGRDEEHAALQAAPHRLLLEGWVPLDSALAPRLDWLIGDYLRLENLPAADELRELADALREEGPGRR